MIFEELGRRSGKSYCPSSLSSADSDSDPVRGSIGTFNSGYARPPVCRSRGRYSRGGKIQRGYVDGGVVDGSRNRKCDPTSMS